ncbi:hypothetical protein GCM10011405_31320 [Rufibacter glacialis]|nr:hypothetical protein GCM10011405_31320 [Rufibacter glacialis]
MLGLIDDYNGRTWWKDNPTESPVLDKFHSTETILVNYLDSLIKETNKRTYDKVQISIEKWEKPNCFYCPEFKRIVSPKLVEQVHAAYSFKWNKEVDEKGYKQLVGLLKPKFFEENQERYSFLAGAYVRYGYRDNEKYTIKLEATGSKFNAIIRELKALRCEIVAVDLKENAPYLQQITFVPTPELKFYLDKQERMLSDILTRKEKFAREKKQNQEGKDLFSTTPDQ